VEYPPRADNAVSVNNTDDEIGPSTVTLSEAMGLEMLRRAQHNSAVTHTDAWINLFICIISGVLDKSTPTGVGIILLSAMSLRDTNEHENGLFTKECHKENIIYVYVYVKRFVLQCMC